MKFKGKTYETMKWVVNIVLPALVALLLGLAPIWNLDILQPIAGTVALIDVFLGACLQISRAQFQKDLKLLSDTEVLDGELVVQNNGVDPLTVYAAFEDHDQLNSLQDKGKVTLRVVKPDK